MHRRGIAAWVLVLLMVVPAPALAYYGTTGFEAGGMRIENDEAHQTRLWVEVDGDPSEVGQWGPVLEGEVPAVNLAVLPGGQLLYYDGFEVDQEKDDLTHVHFVWNASPEEADSRVARIDGDAITVRTPTPEDGGGVDLFCSGTTITPEGLAIAPGGNRYFTLDEGYPEALFGPIKGANQTLVFPMTPLDEIGGSEDDWIPAPNMTGPRWYPSGLQLPDGDTLVAAGSRTLGYPHSRNTVLETFDPDRPSEGWRVLETSFQVAEGVTVPQQVIPSPQTGVPFVDETHRGPPNVPSYPRLHVVPAGPHQGEVLYASSGYILGPHPTEPVWGSFQTLDPDTGTWEIHTRSTVGVRNLGASVPLMVDASDPEPRYLTFGGSIEETVAASSTAEIVDASGETITSTPTEPMQMPRWSVNGVLLPDGSVLALGGGVHDDVIVYGSPTMAPLNAERFVPSEDGTGGSWQTLPAMDTVRAYHSTAVLLPDARVAVGGHVPPPPVHELFRANGNPQANDSTIEIYEPAYLHHGDETRPSIVTDAFDEALPGPSDALFVPWHRDAVTVPVEGLEEGLDSLVLRRPGAATHQYNADQLGVELTVTETRIGPDGSGTVTFDVPDELSIAPGYYMLFANEATEDGVYPSEAAWIALGEETRLTGPG